MCVDFSFCARHAFTGWRNLGGGQNAHGYFLACVCLRNLVVHYYPPVVYSFARRHSNVVCLVVVINSTFSLLAQSIRTWRWAAQAQKRSRRLYRDLTSRRVLTVKRRVWDAWAAQGNHSAHARAMSLRGVAVALARSCASASHRATQHCWHTWVTVTASARHDARTRDLCNDNHQLRVVSNKLTTDAQREARERATLHAHVEEMRARVSEASTVLQTQ